MSYRALRICRNDRGYHREHRGSPARTFQIPISVVLVYTYVRTEAARWPWKRREGGCCGGAALVGQASARMHAARIPSHLMTSRPPPRRRLSRCRFLSPLLYGEAVNCQLAIGVSSGRPALHYRVHWLALLSAAAHEPASCEWIREPARSSREIPGDVRVGIREKGGGGGGSTIVMCQLFFPRV